MIFDLSPKEIIVKYGFTANKSFGQNFIINPSLTDKIVSNVADLEAKKVVEVGPGPSCLTRSILLAGCKNLTVIEKDSKFLPLLRDIKKDYEFFNIVVGDALKESFSVIGSELTIISNLPYNISTPFLIKTCFESDDIDEMYLMFQKEVADRIVSSNGSKKWGRLSVMAQSFFDIEKIMDVSPNSFSPPPKVDSAILKFKKNKKIPEALNIKKLEDVVRLIFSQRRKKLNSVLKKYDLGGSKIDLNLRAEMLSLSDIYELSQCIIID
jgi:16S rRNA (adenine1518-N6/adenine1519-N6)-dimethyltransferase